MSNANTVINSYQYFTPCRLYNGDVISLVESVVVHNLELLSAHFYWLSALYVVD